MKKKLKITDQIILAMNNAKNTSGNEQEIADANFETAISATSFGKFNFLLLVLSVPCCWASMMDTSSMSYVVPGAYCDLDLSLRQRGMLNAITHLEVHSWNFAAIGHCFLPESPKFLMMVERNEEALRVFKKVYSFNTGNDPYTFPIKSLVNETKLNTDSKHGGTVTANRTKTQALKEGWQQIAPMFFPPHLWKISLVATIQCGLMLETNTLRLWLPQICTAMNDYQLLHVNETASLCTMLFRSDYINYQCYYDNHRLYFVALSVTSSFTSLGLYFTQNSATVVALSAVNKKRLFALILN